LKNDDFKGEGILNLFYIFDKCYVFFGRKTGFLFKRFLIKSLYLVNMKYKELRKKVAESQFINQ